MREFPLKPGHGKADYLLYVDKKAVGVVEAKPEGTTLTGVEVQSGKYSTGLPDTLPAHERPLPLPRLSHKERGQPSPGPGTAPTTPTQTPARPRIQPDIPDYERRSL